ncbi:UDP-N-acetylmuramoyl-L-alanine--D-glutamate ligase [Alphaproteobacteria bacterium]|nr:UDP-N-acetylmuramoyl-L-alanine--D-glutamate ligase [Alphaproteobacteria bacterium]
MIIPNGYNSKKVAVFGLARSGLSTIESLKEGNAIVYAWDDNPKMFENINKNKIILSDFNKLNFNDFYSLVLSPGIPFKFPAPHPFVLRARESNCEVIGDIELFMRSSIKSKTIGITGTNGKSTTTSLIGHLLSNNNIETEIVGNIGQPILKSKNLDERGVYIIELSSYQIDLSPNLDLDIAILLNISPDHIDRHGSLENYINIKKRIFSKNPNQKRFICIDDSICRKIYSELKEKNLSCTPISMKNKISNGIYVQNKNIVDSRPGKNISLNLNSSKILRGNHNFQNAAVSYAVADYIGLSCKSIKLGLKTFEGLPHRLEYVGTYKGIEFINDSKATNITAAVQALSAFSSIYWIVGGKRKDEEVEAIIPFLSNVIRIYSIGESSEYFVNKFKSISKTYLAKTLNNAFNAALLDAQKESLFNPVILLSPACSSFDQFKNYEERGNAFKILVDKVR